MNRTEHRNQIASADQGKCGNFRTFADAADARRRATLEERLAAALADGDAEMVSRIREELATAEDADFGRSTPRA